MKRLWKFVREDPMQALGTALSFIGAVFLTIPMPTVVFSFFLFSCLFWLIWAWRGKHWGFFSTQCCFAAVNFISLARIFSGTWHQ